MGKDVARLNRTRGTRLLSLALGGALLLAGLTVAPAAFAAPGADCQPFSSTPCLLPFPNNLYTVKDNSTPTGVRVHLPAAAMPTNKANVAISSLEYNRNDGFSPGSDIVVRVPGLDNPAAIAKTKPAPLTDLAQARNANAPIVVIDAATGKRRVIWAELDSNASDAAHTTLLIHAAKNFTEGHRYIVAMRNLKDKNGAALQAPSWFAKLRDNKPLPAAEQSQKARYDSIFQSLDKAGIARNNSLYEAWDFTVMSRQSLTSRMLQIRNNAFGTELGDTNLADGQPQGTAPTFTVGSTTNNPATGIAKEVTGTFQVPCYLNDTGCSPTPSGTTDGGGFHYSSSSPDAVPTRKPGNTATAQFDCIIPTSASAGSPARPSLYGHGLLGSADEVDAGNVEAMASEHDMMFCATDWWGLASGDVPFDIAALQDLNKFPDVVDRLQQGVLNTLYLEPTDEELRRVRHRSGVPERRQPAAVRAPPTVLRRQQPGRNHGRHDHRGRARLHARRAGRPRNGLRRAAAPAEHRLRRLCELPLRLARSRRLHRRLASSADPRPDAAALGSRRGGRLCPAHDLLGAAQHPAAQGPDAGRLRRPSGQHVLGGRRGADDRRQVPLAGARPARAQPGQEHVLRA